MLTRFAVLTAAALLFVSTAGADEVSKRAKVDEMLRLTKANEMVTQMIPQIKAVIDQQVTSSVPPEQRAKVMESVNKFMPTIEQAMSWQNMRPRIVQVYMEVFDESDLDGIIAFYKTPAGQSLINKMPAIMTRTMQITQDMMKDLMPQMMKSMQDAAEQK